MMARWDIRTNALALTVSYTNLQTQQVYDCGTGPVETLPTALAWVAAELMPLESVFLNGQPYLFPTFSRPGQEVRA